MKQLLERFDPETLRADKATNNFIKLAIDYTPQDDTNLKQEALSKLSEEEKGTELNMHVPVYILNNVLEIEAAS